jgi:agmatinase
MFDPSELPGDLAPGTVAVLGIPSDVRSSFLKGAAEAPARIRHVLHAGSTNMCCEDGTDLGIDGRFQDLGDLELGTVAEIESGIEKAIRTLLDREARVISLGGDHAVTYPVLRAYSKKYENLEVLHLDAHPDLYDEYDGLRQSHACTFARVMEENLAGRLVQVGIRAATTHQREQARRFGVEVIEAAEFPKKRPVKLDGPIYLSLDMDVLDPAYAPGVSHQEPGGLSTRDVLEIIHGLDAPVVGADIVELNPGRDSSDITAMTAAKFLKEIAAAILRIG